MSAYTFPLSGGLQATFNGVPIAVFMNDTPIGPVLIAARNLPGEGWIAFWTHGPRTNEQFQAEVDAVGGVIAWIKSFVQAINEAFAKVFSTAPPAPPSSNAVFSVQDVNRTLAANFVLLVTPSGPVFGPKA